MDSGYRITMAEVTIQIVGWNSRKVLEPGLKKLQAIPANEVVIRYLDNASTDDSVALVRRLLPQAIIVELPTNHGFAGAHNIGFAHCTTPYVLTHDPDIELDWPAAKRLLQALTDPTVAAVQGKLLRAEKTTEGQPIIDSAGIMLTAALNGRERGSHEEDRGQHSHATDLIAVTGACGLYRIATIRQVAHAGRTPAEIYDEDFFAYKEDVDLGWRLKRAGYRSVYVPVAVATHRRTLGRRGAFNWGLDPRAIYQRLHSPRTRYSLRNWIWMIIKNASLKEDLMHEIPVDLRLLVFFLLSLLYPPLFTVWGEVIQGIPRMIAKRKQTAGGG
jgi:GT2 family glycosyltransferase